MKEKTAAVKIKLPKGVFCGGNCADCNYWNPSDNRGNQGMGYCNGGYGGYQYPSDRNGCIHHSRHK